MNEEPGSVEFGFEEDPEITKLAMDLGKEISKFIKKLKKKEKGIEKSYALMCNVPAYYISKIILFILHDSQGDLNTIVSFIPALWRYMWADILEFSNIDNEKIFKEATIVLSSEIRNIFPELTVEKKTDTLH